MDVHSLAAAHLPLNRPPRRLDARAEERFYRDAQRRLPTAPAALRAPPVVLAVMVLIAGLAAL